MFDFFKKDRYRQISEELLQKDFLRTVSHYVAFSSEQGKKPLNIVTLSMEEGVLASISLDEFQTAQDETGRIILTHRNRTAQIILDYTAKIVTVTFGCVLYDTYEMPKVQKTDYHG